MSNLMLGNGDDVIDPLSERMEELEAENREHRQRIRDLEMELSRTKRENARAIASLRQVLSPLFSGLKQIFGEMDAIGGAESTSEAPTDSKKSKVWEMWKSRLGEGCAKVIDALMLHGEMNTTQLSIATGYHRTSIPAFIFKLNKAGLLNKNGGRFALKEL
jgi:hypothetical protein